MPAWTHTVSVRWPASLRYFDERANWLRDLEQQDLLDAFRWSENVVGARLGHRELIEVSSQGALVATVGPEARLAEAREALATAVDMIRPSAVSLVEAMFQFVLPLDVSYEQARRATAAHVLQSLLPQSPTTPTDWSLLIDGLSRRVRATFQVEFGIISDREAPERIARRVGRVRGSGLAPFPEDLYEEEDYPPCAFYFDWRWSPGASVSADAVRSDLFRVWNTLAEESQEMCAAVQAGAGMTDKAVTLGMEAES